MPKVLLVAHWDWVLAHFRLPIAKALREHGAEVVFVCPPGESTDSLQAEGFRWVQWDVDRQGLAPHRELGSMVRLAAIYRRERPHAVQHFTIKPVVYGSLAARAAGVPLAINVFSGLGYVFSEQGRHLRRLILPLLRRSGRAPRTWTFTLNREDLALLHRLRIAPVGRSGLLPEGVDTERFRPAQESGFNDVPVVLMASRLLYAKGVADLVAAAEILERRGVDVRVRIAGAPDSGNPDAVSQRDLERWKREGRVELLGARTDVDELLRSADIAVLPTHYKEGMPWFLLEAGASGVPLVASDVPGCREVVRDGITGLRVPTGDPDSLATAIARLVEDPYLRASLGAEARSVVQVEHSEGRVRDHHVDLYRRLGVLPPSAGAPP